MDGELPMQQPCGRRLLHAATLCLEGYPRSRTLDDALLAQQHHGHAVPAGAWAMMLQRGLAAAMRAGEAAAPTGGEGR